MIKVTEEQSLLIERCLSQAAVIQSMIDNVVEKLESYYEEQISSRAGVTVQDAEDPRVLRYIKTPCGEGRLTSTIDMADGVIAGRITVEKCIWASDGKPAWRPVWLIRIGEHGRVHLGAEEDAPTAMVLDRRPGYSDDIYLVANSILAAIAIAPSRES